METGQRTGILCKRRISLSEKISPPQNGDHSLPRDASLPSDVLSLGDAYLTRLTLALVAGAASLSPSTLDIHREFLRSRQRPDGGWAGREGSSDPYYTAFALRGLWICGGLDAAVAGKAADFFRGKLQSHQSVVDLMSLIFGAAILEIAASQTVIGDDGPWADRVAALMSTMRTGDGGFAKTPEGRAGSTYQTFLSTLCFELIQQPVPNKSDVARFLNSQRQSDGGYLEIRAAKRAGVNPTAAAIGTLRCIGELSNVDWKTTLEFLQQRQNHDGGFSANTRIPFSDLLSTFTAIWTIVDILQSVDQDVDGFSIDDVAGILRRAGRYARQMSHHGGGFVGFELDETPDVEYTFYGLAVTALVTLADESGEGQTGR